MLALAFLFLTMLQVSLYYSFFLGVSFLTSCYFSSSARGNIRSKYLETYIPALP